MKEKMALERAPDDPLKIYPVSDLVNSPKADDPRCIEPVQIDRDTTGRLHCITDEQLFNGKLFLPPPQPQRGRN
jgi:hypothetical protein